MTRYAYDETAEGDDVARVCGMLADVVPARDKRVYVLIGNESFEGYRLLIGDGCDYPLSANGTVPFACRLWPWYH